MGLNPSIQKAVQHKGFARPSEIQATAIPLSLQGKDLVGKSKTGTGKTAAFAIPLVQLLKPGESFSGLVVVPTRELALQVHAEIESLARGSGVSVVPVYGGQKMNIQLVKVQRKPEIIVGTPGRLLDMLENKLLTLRKVKILVLDEADKMFDMGFREDVEDIISRTPKERQTLLFSATLSKEIRHLMERNLKHDKIVLDLSEDNAPVQEVEQFYVMVDRKRKVEQLHKVLMADSTKTLVFCRTKRTVDWLSQQLRKRGLPTLAIHGDKPQNVRTAIIEKFKRSKDAILLATDIVARGIHVDDIGSVINFDLPGEEETYLHRIGRTARQGKKGRAISFCSSHPELVSLEKVGAKNQAVIRHW